MSRASAQYIGESISEGLQSVAKGYAKGKEDERNMEILNNPKASPLHRAIAASKINPKLVDYMAKQQQFESSKNFNSTLMKDVQSKLNMVGRGVQGGGEVNGNMPEELEANPPNINALRQELQEPEPIDPIQMKEEEAKIYEDAAMEAEQGGEKGTAARLQNLGNQSRQDARAMLKEKGRIEAAQVKAQTNTQKNLLMVDARTADYDKQIQKEAKTARASLHASGAAKKAILSGNVNPKTVEGLARAIFKDTVWKNYFSNPDVATLEIAGVSSFEGARDMFGGKLSDADLKAISGKVISSDKTPEQNLAIIEYRDFMDRMKIVEADIGDQIKAENGGYRPINYDAQVRKRMQEQHGEEASRVVSQTSIPFGGGQPIPEPSKLDPLMISAYGPVKQGKVRFLRGKEEVIDVEPSKINNAIRDGFELLEQGAM